MHDHAVPISGLLLLAACGPAKLDGPLTQAKLDEVASGCGVSGATLVSADAGGKARISVSGSGLGGSDSDVAKGIYAGKCIEDALKAMGVDNEVTMNLDNTDIQRQMQKSLDDAVIR